MWGQVSMRKALQAFLSGRTVKVVDFNAETVLSLSEVLERFSEGVAFFTEMVATENLEFSEAVEEMTAASPLNDGTIRGTVTIEENGDIHVTRPKPAEPDPDQSAPKKRGKKTVDDVEREYANRKITDLEGLRALRAAGWPVKKIAEEFRCSEATVYNTLKRLEEQEAEA